MQYCHTCDKQIDTDFDAEHFDDHQQPNPEVEEDKKAGNYQGE